MDEQVQYDTAEADTASQEQSLAEREAAVAKREMRAAAIERLSERRLPAKLIGCMDFSSQESFEESFDAVCESFSEAISEGMKQRFHGEPPKRSPAGPPDAFLEGLGIIRQ